MKSFTCFMLTFTVVFADQSTESFIKTNDRFTASIYKEVSKHGEYIQKNLLVSPFSVETLLSLSQFGARGSTAEELEALLQLSDKDIFKSVLTKLQKNETYSLQIANKIYIIKEKMTVKEEFKDVATRVYFSDAEAIDFTQNTKAAEAINHWVEARTRNKIHDLVKPDDITNRTRLVSVNALYFKGVWWKSFFTDLTSKRDFHVTSEDTQKVETMHSRYGDYFLYYECPHLKAKFLELLFDGGASMTFILPNENDGLASLESQIDRVLTPHNLTHETVLVALPKFKIENRIDFIEVLKKLGVQKAFDAGEADFSGIAGVKGDLIIDKIVQKTFIDVNEGGVEAAAATFISYPVPPSAIPEPKEFKADHPFLFYIRVNGVVIFVGRVLRPEL